MEEIRAVYNDFQLRCTYTARNGYTYSSDVTRVISIPISIPQGTTINDAYFTATFAQRPFYGGVLKFDGVRYPLESVVKIPLALNADATTYTTTMTFNTWGNVNAPADTVQSTTLDVTNIAVVINVSADIGKCTPPTSGSISVHEVTTDDPVTMTWSGATGGQNNPITGYTIEYSEGDSTGWVKEADTATNVASIRPGAMEVVRVYRIRANGQAGEEYASDWYYMPGYLKKTENPGGGGTTLPANPHDNIPPYKAVNIWRRVN